jgi:membrane associated rhomboid family serine protease/Zn-finger nucleic acid-binding protein
LTPVRAGEAVVDRCERCGGKFFDRDEVGLAFPDLGDWTSVPSVRRSGRSRLRCPKDEASLTAFRIHSGDDEIEVDVCPSCDGLWLDRAEASRLRAITADAARAESRIPGIGSYLFQLFTGFPIEVWNPVRRVPWVVYAISGAILLGFLIQVALVSRHGIEGAFEILRPWTIVPTEILGGRHLLGLLTHGFLHAGLLHLAGNLYFLLVFGDNVEDALGHLRFAVLFFAALLAGAAAQVLATPTVAEPMLGASGAVSGVLGAYLVLFPRVQVWTVIFFIRFRLGILWYLGLWLLLQFLFAALGREGIAWYAHLGGFVCGVILAPALGRPVTTLAAEHEVVGRFRPREVRRAD